MREKKGPVVLIIILLIIILGLGGYIAVDKLILNKNDEEVRTVVTIDDNNIDLNALYQIGDTLTKFDNAFNDLNSNYFGYLYQIDQRLMASKFDNGAALFVAMHDDMVGTSSAQYLIGGNVKKEFEKIFGKNLVYKPANVAAGKSFNIIYNEGNGNFTYTAPTMSNVYASQYIAKNMKTELDDDMVKITRRVFFVEYKSSEGSSDITKVDIYTNHNKNKLVGSLNLRNNVLSEEEVLAKFASKLDKYVFTFKQNDKVDEYCFYSIEKVK